MVRNVKSSLYQRLVKCIVTVPSERCEKIEFGSLSKIIVIPLFSRESTLFVKGYYMTWKGHLPSSIFFFISSGFDPSINFIAENVQKYMKFFD